MRTSDRLDSWKEIASYLGRSVPTVQRWEKKEGLPIRRHVHERQGSIYAYKSEIDRWKNDRGGTLEDIAPLHEKTSAPQWKHLLVGAVVLGCGMGVLAMWWVRAARIRWVEQEALPQIEHLRSLDSANFSSGDDSLFRAYQLVSDARYYAPGDGRVRKMWATVSRPMSITTDPPGADVYVSSYSGNQNLHIGRTPLQQVPVPLGLLHWRADKKGYDSVEGLFPKSDSIHVKLEPNSTSPAGMVKAPGGTFKFELTHLGSHPPFEVEEFWIDKYEVTNREFRKFVDAGGYADPRYWKQPFIKDGRTLSFSEAMQFFHDHTGRPGPATWEAGDFPEGYEEYPVTGVSWYEAAAFAEFAGKRLPTIFEWIRAADVSATSAIAPLSNFSGKSLAPVGQYHGTSGVGALDMAGNVKEWCFNSTGDDRFILGGAWNEPVYMFSEADGQPPFSRADNFGFRLVKNEKGSPSLMQPVEYPHRDFSKETPVTESVFSLMRSLYAYDKPPLHASVDAVDDSDEHWRKERVSYDAAYGNERISAYVFLPRNATRPYQTLVYFPGSSAIQLRSSAEVQPGFGAAVIRSGRAFVFPVYKGTYERGDAITTDYPSETDLYRQHALAWYKDLARTLDYLQTRPDIDAARFAYYGFSWGARLGPIFLAVDSRFKTAILLAGGLKFARSFPEADPFNFVPHVTLPVLMINGKYDYFFPLETSQQPLFRLLGTTVRDKRHIVLESGHAPPIASVSKDVLDWLDKYLGSVNSGAR